MSKFLRFMLPFFITICPIIGKADPLIKNDMSIKKSFSLFKIGSRLKVIQILPSVFIVEANDGPAPAYSMIVELSANILLIVDSPYTAQYSKILLEWIYQKFGKRKMLAINTHYHLDRIGGNEIWIKEKIPVYGSDLTAFLIADAMKKNNKQKMNIDLIQYLSDLQLKKAFKVMNITPPDYLFPLRQGKILFIGSRKVEIFYPGPAHAPDNIVVYIPHLKLLFGGCLVVALPKIYLMEETNIGAWTKAIARLKRFQAQWVIPGHPASLSDDLNFSPKLIQHTEALLNSKAFIKFNKKI